MLPGGAPPDLHRLGEGAVEVGADAAEAFADERPEARKGGGLRGCGAQGPIEVREPVGQLDAAAEIHEPRQERRRIHGRGGTRPLGEAGRGGREGPRPESHALHHGAR